ncbi:hypothetical protein GCM10020331_067920 [Ectobacillus funiculus]
MTVVAVAGAGSWGTALAMVLADNGHEVRLWGHREELMQEINETRMNNRYLPGVELPDGICAYASLESALQDAEHILLVVPTKAYRDVLRQIRPMLSSPVTFIHASKGIEPDSSKRISEVIEEEIPAHLIASVVVLSGPSHAEEVGLRHPTTVTSASKHLEAAEMVQDLFMNSYFRVYTNPDIIGVELGGALKNIIALAAGITDGLGLGDNAKSSTYDARFSGNRAFGTNDGSKSVNFCRFNRYGRFNCYVYKCT